jgi:hypothetical protein
MDSPVFQTIFYSGCGGICGSMVAGMFDDAYRSEGFWIGAVMMLCFELYIRVYKKRR